MHGWLKLKPLPAKFVLANNKSPKLAKNKSLKLTNNKSLKLAQQMIGLIRIIKVSH